MAHTYSWYYADKHTTYRKGDLIKMTGTYYSSADGEKVAGTHNNTSRYFYSYYTNTAWEVLAPICFGYISGYPWAYAKPETIVSGGELDTYTIKYDANGGTGAPSTQVKPHGHTLKLSTDIPTRTGYNFSGWAISKYSMFASYQAGSNFTGNYNITLYALWSPQKHTVAYHANGGSGAPSSQTKTYGYPLTLSTIIPTKEGHTFLGWGTSASDTTVDYASGAQYTRDQNGGTYTLYAIWEPYTYIVGYDANGGSNNPKQQTKIYGVDLILTSDKPTRSNYLFLGWGLTSNATEVAYNAGSIYTNNKAIMLYAVWKKDIYNVTYELNGGVNSVNNKTTVECGTALTLYNPTKEGHTFVAWHLNSANGTVVTSIDSNNTSNITLYAEWKVNTYTISFDLNGGKHEGKTQVAVIEANFGSTINLFIPEKDNHDFNKWSVEGLGSVSSDNLKFTVGASDTKLKAIWGLEVKTVTYNANGGTLGTWSGGYAPPNEEGVLVLPPSGIGGEFATVQYQYGDDISAYDIPTVTRDRYKFLGWYLGETKIESPFSVVEDIELIAKWQKDDTCYVYNKHTSFTKGLPFLFTKENDSIKGQEGFIYVFKDGKFRRGYIK